MATASAGITVTFGAVTFSEITDLSWSYGGGSPKGRDSAWTDEVGSLTLTCLGSAGTSTSNYGQRGQLAVTGGGAALTTQAVYEGVSVTPELNGVTRYTVTFKLLDG